MYSFAKRPISLEASNNAVPKWDCSQKIPAKSVTFSDPTYSEPEKRNLWDGRNRRVLHLAVEKERRAGVSYLASTPDFIARAEKAKIKIMTTSQGFKDLPFSEAAPIWLEEQKLYHSDKPKTIRSYADYVKRLETVFGSLKLSEIHIGHIREYQVQQKAKYNPRCINSDISLLSRVLRKAGLWAVIKEHYRALPVPKWTPPRVLTDAEEDHLFLIASRNPEFELAYWVASLTNNTSASGCELRGLKLKHIDLNATPPILYVPSDKVKNEYRARVIPLNERGEKIMRRIIDRAASLGSTQPEHYLFPLRVRTGKKPIYDPTRPASESFLRKQWNKMRIAAGFSWLRPHDLRHQIITKLLENGVPEQTVMAITGHVSREMLEYYSHQRVDAKFRALDIINPDRKRPQSVVKKSGKGVSA